MAVVRQNSSNQSYKNNADGWELSGGTTPRKLTTTGGDVSVTGAGSNTYTFPPVTTTLQGLCQVVAQSTSATVSPTIETLYLSTPGANITLTLGTSAVSNTGLKLHFKKVDSSAFTVTIDAAGSETIDGATTAVIISQYQSITIISDGVNWHII
jgi:hypothetical protein